MPRQKGARLVSKSKVARILTSWINSAAIQQSDIAKVLGLSKPNVISMFKSGRSPLPAKYIVPLARCLGRDPEALLDIWLEEYQPELTQALVKYKAVIISDGPFSEL